MIVNAHSRVAKISMKRAKVHLQGETCVKKSKKPQLKDLARSNQRDGPEVH
jgi:hypothetical protein